MKPQPIDTAPQEEEKPLLLYCPEHGEWRIGVRYLDSWLDLYDLCELWPTHWLPLPPNPEDDEPSPSERIVPWDPEE